VSKWDKFEAYWEEFGSPELERRQQGEEAWNSLVAVDFKFCGCCEYRIAGDRHWELRLKWVNSDKTLPIEYRSTIDGEWLIVTPIWDQEGEYREAKQEEITITDVSQERLSADSDDPGAHYRYEYKGIKLDPARIARIYGVTDGMIFTILKKCLRMGRAHKDKRQDLLDIISAAKRELEMMDEDEA
jgi:hypothetical protein